MESKVLLAELYPLVEKGLNKKENVKKLKEGINNYLDRNNEYLTTIGPTKKPMFTDTDMTVVYNAIEVGPKDIKIIINKSSTIKGQWQIMNNPFNSACALAIRYFKLNKNDDMANTVLIYLTMSMYPSLHFKYFQYEPNENIMNYTINNLSNKFKIKQVGTIYHALIETTQGSYKLHSDDIDRCTDKDVVMFIMDIKTRLNSMLKKIAIEFYKNKENNNYLNSDVDNYEEDNYHEADSNTYAIERVTNNVVLKLVVSGPNIMLVNVAAKWCHVSVSELRNYVNTMVTNENREDIRHIVEGILFLYIFDSQNKIEEISSNKFLVYCLGIYKKSNTTDKNIISIKNILDKWLLSLGTYEKTERKATINDFRRALFTFFVLSIQNSMA